MSVRPAYRWILCAAFTGTSAASWAATSLPPAAELQRLQDVLLRQPPSALPGASLLHLPAAPSPTESQIRQDTRFTLEGVEIRGMKQLSPTDVLPLFSTLTGQQTSLAEVDKAVVGITTAYRQQGYFLSHAFLPPQEVSTGIVIIQVVEGYISDIQLEAPPKVEENPLVKSLVEEIRKPNITSAELENILLRLNALPGLTASGNLSPGTTPGASVLTLTMKQNSGSANVGLSNHGTRYIGPNEFEGGVTINNLISPGGDNLTVQGVQTPTGNDLTFLNARYSVPLNSMGTTLQVQGFHGDSHPKWILQDLNIASESDGFSLTLDQTLARQRDTLWDVFGTFDWNDATSTSFKSPLSTDHLRVLRTGTALTTTDDLDGLTTTRLELSRGLPILGATEPGTLGGSRLRGNATEFTKGTLEVSRLQRLNPVWNVLLAGGGQFSTHALPAGEEFGLGGESFGRGYDSNELSGDHGLGGRAELQLTFPSEAPWMDTWQLFGFYDYGLIWNKDRALGEPNTPQSLASLGYGARLTFTPSLSGELMYAKPLNRPVQTNGDKNPTIYFRLKGKLDFEKIGHHQDDKES